MNLADASWELDRLVNNPIFSPEMKKAAKIASYLLSELRNAKACGLLSEELNAQIEYTEKF